MKKINNQNHDLDVKEYSSGGILTVLEQKTLMKKDEEQGREGSRARLVLKNSGALGISAVLGKLLYFSLFVFIGRYLGPSDLGKLTFAISFIAMFAVISDLGLNVLTVREVSADRSLTNKYLNNLAALKSILAFLALSLIMLMVILLGYPRDTIKVVFLLGIATFFTNISSGIRWIFQSHLKLEYESALNIIQNVLGFSLGYLVLKLNWGIYGIGYSQVFVWFLVLVFSWILISVRFVRINFEFDFAFWRKLLKSSIPFALVLVFTSLYLNLDTVLLSLFKGDQAVGLYNAANRLILAGKTIPGIIIPAIFPIMSEMSKKSKEEFDRFLGKSLTLVFCLALPISVGATFLADKIIRLLYGVEFPGSAHALQILIWGMCCMYLSIVAGYALTAKGHQKINTITCGIGLGISLLINFSLIQRWGYLGTSIAVLATEFFVMAATMFYARKVMGFGFKTILVPFLKVVLATSVMSVTLYLTRELNLFLCTAAGVISYLLVLFSLKGLYGYDFYKLKDLILTRT